MFLNGSITGIPCGIGPAPDLQLIKSQLRTIIINNNSRLASTALVLFGLLSSASVCAGDVHDCTVTVDAEISRLLVQARFASGVESVTARSRGAGKFLLDAHDRSHDALIRVHDRHMLLPRADIRWINHTVDPRKVAKAERRNITLAPTNIVVAPAA